jgi:hypothetical protein
LEHKNDSIGSAIISSKIGRKLNIEWFIQVNFLVVPNAPTLVVQSGGYDIAILSDV